MFLFVFVFFVLFINTLYANKKVGYNEVSLGTKRLDGYKCNKEFLGGWILLSFFL